MSHVFILGVFILSGCYSATSGKKTESRIPGKTVISIPKTLRPVQSTLEYTSYIGTPDHPTIDGGIINSTDGMPVNHDMPSTKPLFPQQQAVKVTLIKASEDNQKPFKDNWATSEKVKRLLIEAASQGKLDYVLKKTDQMKLPASVAVVPMVESNYQTQAVSPKGAAGAWQLMPSTAKDYGINNQERFQFTTSTDTALKLLNNLHQQFGNWELAFAAYNAGNKRVCDAMQENPNAKTIDELDLPQETKTYLYKIMAIDKFLIRN